jgi:hypothetical protein
MSKKVLDIEDIKNELEGASLFFTQPAKSPAPKTEPENIPLESVQEIVSNPTENSSPGPNNPPIEKTTTKAKIQSKKQASTHASKHASIISEQPYDLVEAIRRTVKQVGKDSLFVRVTPGEKRAVLSAVYSFNELYSGGGRKTTENEISRIAINLLLEDYRENGNNSILARVLASLNA